MLGKESHYIIIENSHVAVYYIQLKYADEDIIIIGPNDILFGVRQTPVRNFNINCII